MPRNRVSRTTGMLAALLLAVPAAARAQNAADSVRQVVLDAYVGGIHVNRDSAAVRRGFHPRFVMAVHQGDSVSNVTLDEWLSRMAHGQRNPNRIEAVLEQVDVTGNTATAKLRLSVNGRLRFTDYLGLYRFAGGWRIVNKVFQSHQ